MAEAVRRSESPTALSLYLADVKRRSPLSEKIWVSEEEDWRRLVEDNLAFVLRIAGEYRNCGLAFEDIVNEGNLGLLKAARRYDPSRGYKFTTYAVWWIRKSILKALGEQTRVVRVPVYLLRERKKLSDAGPKVPQVLRKKKSAESLRRREDVVRMPLTELSLDAKIGEDRSSTYADRLEDPKSRNPEESLLRDEARHLVAEAIERLPDQERMIIRYRFGLEGERPLVLKQIGKRLGISRERVRQIEVQAKARMRRYFRRRSAIYPDSFAEPLSA
jgi:RNA polymerase primary sigma factor